MLLASNIWLFRFATAFPRGKWFCDRLPAGKPILLLNDIGSRGQAFAGINLPRGNRIPAGTVSRGETAFPRGNQVLAWPASQIRERIVSPRGNKLTSPREVDCLMRCYLIRLPFIGKGIRRVICTPLYQSGSPRENGFPAGRRLLSEWSSRPFSHGEAIAGGVCG